LGTDRSHQLGEQIYYDACLNETSPDILLSVAVQLWMNGFNVLRLVAGTEVKNAGRESSDQSVKGPAAVTTAAPAIQEALARKLVLEHRIAGKTVQQMIEESDAPADSSDRAAGLASMTAFTTGCVALTHLGIVLASGGHNLGLTLDSYATVVDGKRLVRRIPQLKKLTIDLAGLARTEILVSARSGRRTHRLVCDGLQFF